MGELGRLVNLESDGESNSDSENVPPQKKRRQYCEYVHIRDFESLEAAKLHIRKEGRYNYINKRESSDGVKVYHKCKHATCTLKSFLQLTSM